MSATRYRFGPSEVLVGQRRLLVDGKSLALGARAFDMLVALLERHERVVSREELFELVWPGLVVEENNLRQQVSALRRLLGPEVVVTVPGRGYRFGLPLVDGDLDVTGPAPAGLHAGAPPNNLPLTVWPLIGRDTELATLPELLARTQLLTLTGAGGVGKTRLALEVAARAAPGYTDGVWLVELAPVADAGLVPQTVASALGVHEEPGRPLMDTVLRYLRPRRVLIVLDNCEHLIDACAAWADKVLRSSAGAHMLATSREAMRLDGEMVWRVPSLGTADPGLDVSADRLIEFPATQLFVQRATAALPSFRLTPHNAPAVARICRQLDGIPLGLELAAAQVRAMRVEQLAERLRDRFALLTRGTRVALERHQTLRSLVDWSHELLAEPERMLLRLSVFAGGWTLEAAEAVCSGGALAAAQVLDLLGRLVEQSLVTLDEQAAEPRYRMLETIRQYALEKLAAAGEADDLRCRHLAYYAEFAEGLREPLFGPETVRCCGLINTELDNLRIALDWAERPGQAGLGLHLVQALHRYWYQYMHWREIAARVERLAPQSRADGPPGESLARALYCVAMMVTNFDPPAGRRLAEECLALSRAIGFDEGMAWALMWLGYIDSRKRDPATRELFAESLRLGAAIADSWRQAALLVQAMICSAGYEALMGRDDAVERIVADCEGQIARLGGDILYTGHCQALLGTMATRRGEFERASRLLAESLALYRRIDSKFDIAGSLVQQGFLALQRGQPEGALALFRESLPLHRNYPTSPWVTKGLAHVLIACAACERWTIAARLAGVLGSAGEAGPSSERAPPELSGRVARAYEAAVTRAREALGEPAFGHESSAGRRMSGEEAIALALGG